MSEARPWDYNHGDTCEECGILVTNGSKYCSRHQPKYTQGEIDERKKLARHRRVKQIQEENGLSALAALEQARREWGEI